MRIRWTQIVILLLISIILSCTEKNNIEKLSNEKNKDLLNDIFTTVDSCYLNYHIEGFPSIIYDVAMTNNSIYVCGQSKNYPIVKFNKRGEYLGAIGGIGSGPGEFITSPTRMDVHNNLLAVLLTEFNKIVLFKDDKFCKEKYFSKNYRFSDLAFINDSTLLVSGYGSSEKHLVIIDTSINLIKSYTDIPETSKIAGIISTQSWGIQFSNNKIISHYIYPNVIIKSDYDLKDNKISNINYLSLNLEKFQSIDSSKIKNILSTLTGHNRFEIFDSISKIYWVMNIQNYLIGTYFYQGSIIGKRKMKKKILRLFVVKGNKTIIEHDLDFRSSGFLIPQKDKIISFRYKKRGSDLKVKLYQLSLNIKKL